MVIRCRIHLIALACLFFAVPVLGANSGSLAALAVSDRIEQQAMIFFVAKGPANSCGPGCSEWIAAEGSFDLRAHERLLEFLSRHRQKNLPIFFHSPGGRTHSSMKLGRILRERGMTAGIGRTIPEGCKDDFKPSDSCRRIMSSAAELKARLSFNRASCFSNCAFAFLGASARTVATGARLGVHASSMTIVGQNGTKVRGREDHSAAMAQVYDHWRRYAVYMGIDPSLVDLAKEIDPRTIHVLSQSELLRFGVLAADDFETPWRMININAMKPVVVKSITRRTPEGLQRLTTTVELACEDTSITIRIRRELPGNEAPALSLVAGTDVLLDDANEQKGSVGKVSVRGKSVPAELIFRAAANDSLVLREQSKTGSRATGLSTKGLLKALKEAPGGCGHKV